VKPEANLQESEKEREWIIVPSAPARPHRSDRTVNIVNPRLVRDALGWKDDAEWVMSISGVDKFCETLGVLSSVVGPR
jgi:hypothetical protein